MKDSNHLQKTLVLVGGGHSNIQVIKNFHQNPVSNLKIYLVSDQIYAPYSGMLPGLLAGTYGFEETHFDLVAICQRAGVHFVHDEVCGIDESKQIISMKKRPPLFYDVISINVGIRPTIDVDNLNQDQIIPMKPISGFLDKWKKFEEQISSFPDASPPKVAVIGGGAGGVEIAFAIMKNLKVKFPDISMDILELGPHILQGHNSKVREFMEKRLENAGIHINCNTEVTGFEKGVLETKDRKTRNFDFVFWSTTAAAPSWFGELSLAKDKSGFLTTDRFLKVKKSKNVFASGDCIAFDGKALPKSGVFAVRQGPILAENLRRTINLEKSLMTYEPQKNSLAMITTGQKYAVASWGGRCAKGRLLWKVKDMIDRNFMKRFDANSYEMPKESWSSGRNIVQEQDVSQSIVEDAFACFAVKHDACALGDYHLPSKGSSKYFGKDFSITAECLDYYLATKILLEEIRGYGEVKGTGLRSLAVNVELKPSNSGDVQSSIFHVVKALSELQEAKVEIGGVRASISKLSRVSIQASFKEKQSSAAGLKIKEGDACVLSHDLYNTTDLSSHNQIPLDGSVFKTFQSEGREDLATVWGDLSKKRGVQCEPLAMTSILEVIRRNPKGGKLKVKSQTLDGRKAYLETANIGVEATTYLKFESKKDQIHLPAFTMKRRGGQFLLFGSLGECEVALEELRTKGYTKASILGTFTKSS